MVHECEISKFVNYVRVKESEFEYLVENRSNSRMEPADVLSGEVGAVPSELTLTKDAWAICGRHLRPLVNSFYMEPNFVSCLLFVCLFVFLALQSTVVVFFIAR
jgi:hypothetical protein